MLFLFLFKDFLFKGEMRKDKNAFSPVILGWKEGGMLCPEV